MTEKEISELYTRLAFQHESSIDSLLKRRIIDTDIAATSREKFYDSLNEEKLRASKRIKDYHETMRLYMRLMTCKDMVSLTELERKHSEEPPSYAIQSWMRSCNTLEFLRQWENEMNEEFDDRACEELIHQGHTTSLTVTPSLWIRRTHAVRMRVQQGKGGGVSAYPEIAADFHLWLDPKMRLTIIRKHISPYF